MLIVMVTKYPRAGDILSGNSLSMVPAGPSVLAMQQKLKNAEATNPSVRKSGTNTATSSNNWTEKPMQPPPLTCEIEIGEAT
jgi:hypothetical protein